MTWWILTLSCCVAAYFAVVTVSLRRGRNAIPFVNDDELAREVDQLYRWAQRNKRLTHRAEPEPVDPDAPERELDSTASEELPRTAHVVRMPEELDASLAEKLPCWRWAAFASVLVQRRDAVMPRLRCPRLGHGDLGGERLPGGPEVARYLGDRVDELLTLVAQVNEFTLRTVFEEVYADPGDKSSPEADDLMRIANRLMNYHGRFLAIAEQCWAFDVPDDYGDLMSDVSQLVDAPLAAYDQFIDDFVASVEKMPEMLYYAHAVLELNPVVLHIDVGAKLLRRIRKQLNRIGRG